MKIIITWFALLFAGQVSAWAEGSLLSEQRKTAFLKTGHCDSVIRSDEGRLFLGFHASRVEVVDLLKPEAVQTLKTDGRVVDLTPVGKHLWVLTSSHLEEWDLESSSRLGVYSTYATSSHFRAQEGPTGMILNGDELVMSHGRLGYSFFNIQSHHLADQKRILLDQLPMESMAVDIAGSGDRALLAIDNYTLSSNPSREGFRGILVVDLTTHEVIRQLSGIDPGAEGLFIHQDDVFLSFHPPIWKLSLSGLLGSESDRIRPEKTVWKFPIAGDGVGKPFFDEHSIYACFRQRKEGTHQSVLTPVVLDRQALGF